MSDASEWELTPWWLRAFGYKPWRYWTTMINVGGDFSYWTYAGTPNASISNRRAGSENKVPATVQDLVRPIVSVKTMKLSDDRADYFVSIKVGNREVTPHVFREEYKAAYHVALYNWLLNGGGKPDLMAFDEGDWPAQATELCSRVKPLTKTQIEYLANNILNNDDYAYTIECLTYHLSDETPFLAPREEG